MFGIGGEGGAGVAASLARFAIARGEGGKAGMCRSQQRGSIRGVGQDFLIAPPRLIHHAARSHDIGAL
jgi:hypothetical protein